MRNLSRDLSHFDNLSVSLKMIATGHKYESFVFGKHRQVYITTLLDKII